MKKNRRKVYMAAGHHTTSLGTGRKDFHPKKPRPGLEEYIQEAGRAVLARIGGGKNVDEGVIGNFMAARFNKQGHLAAFIPSIDPDLRWKPSTRVECACASGGVALTAAIKSVLAGTADVVLTVGVEVQNTVKAIYGADILGGAGWYRGERKTGHAYFFPALFSDRAGAYFEKFGRDKNRRNDVQTIFSGASFSKPIFAYLVMLLADEHVIDLDKPLYEYMNKPFYEYPDYSELR